MKRNVRLFSMILALLCVVSMIPVMTVTADETTETAQYVDLSDYNDGDTYPRDAAEGDVTYKVVKEYATLKALGTMNVNVILGADIDCSSGWSTINLNGHIFDGNGYAIYGINISGSGNLGLFGGNFNNTTYENQQNSIKNLTVGLPGQKIQMSTSATNCGSGVFAGDIRNNMTWNFENVTVYADITTPYNVVGGFVGLLRKGTLNFTNCNFYGSIDNGTSGSNAAGGFVGEVGRTAGSTATFTNCVNYATLTNNNHTGGFVGRFASGSGFTSVINFMNCVNVGDISGSHAAGFVGLQNGDDSQTSFAVHIENCLNTGYIEAKEWNAAGFVSCVEKKTSVLTVKNSVNLGAIHCSSSKGSAAGLSYRYTPGMVIENCGFFGNVTAAAGSSVAVVRNNAGWSGSTVTGLHYTAISGAADLSVVQGYGDAVSMTLEKGIEWTNDDLLGATLGKVIMNNDGTGAVLAAPTFAGVQESTVVDGKLRFVATLNDSLRYSTVGFQVEHVETGKTVTTECQNVYTTLTSTNDAGLTAEITATELYGTYVFALAIKDIPTDGTVTLRVTPYGKDANSTTEYCGETYDVVYTDGVIVAINACA